MMEYVLAAQQTLTEHFGMDINVNKIETLS